MNKRERTSGDGREALRATLAADIDAFLAKGNTIHRVPGFTEVLPKPRPPSPPPGKTDWREIPDFPAYAINGLMQVRNNKTSRVLSGDGSDGVTLHRKGRGYRIRREELFRAAFRGEL